MRKRTPESEIYHGYAHPRGRWVPVAAICAVAVVGLALPGCVRSATGQASKEIGNGSPGADCDGKGPDAHPVFHERLLHL